MQPETKIDDLEYLAKLGFEKTKVNVDDLRLLQNKIRSHSLSAGNTGYFTFICIITGVFIGVSAVFAIYNRPQFRLSHHRSFKITASAEKEVSANAILDTIEVKQENFIKQTAKATLPTKPESLFPELPEYLEPAVIQELNQSGSPRSEHDLLYIPNSPVLYIHDLKVSDYHKLYFQSSKYVLLNNPGSLHAAMSSTVTANTNLPQDGSAVYKHELLAEALLAFRQKDFPRAQHIFKELAAHNSSDINVLFYSGMCHYYRKNYSEAVKYLDECLSHINNSFFNEAQYYKALALYESGQKGAAIALLKQVIEENGFYALKAQQFLEQDSEFN